MNNYFTNIETFITHKYINKYPIELKDKLLYLLQNGKRLRPILFLIFNKEDTIILDNNIVNNSQYVIYNIAICIELIHSLSLVIDDLPEMDNDSIRRDNQSFHVKYGIDYTNFFIYYMFNNIGLELDTCFDISNYNNNNDNNDINHIKLENNIINDINHIIKLNMNLLIDGQYNDLNWNTNISSNRIQIQNNSFIKEKKIIFELLNINDYVKIYNFTIKNLNEIELNIDLNIDLNMKKTSSLFNLSITTGYILQLWKNNINYTNKKEYIEIYDLLSIFSNILGYMFQISDDIIDIDSDIIKNKPNICSIINTNIVCKLLQNGCNWLYMNAIFIYQLMQQDLGNPARKLSANSIKYDDESKISFNIEAINDIIKKIEKRIELKKE